MANVIFLLKETSVFSAISLMDLMFTAKDLTGLYYKTTSYLQGATPNPILRLWGREKWDAGTGQVKNGSPGEIDAVPWKERI